MDMRKLLLCAFLLSATSLLAKSYESYSKKEITWESRPLQLDDFLGKRAKNDTMAYRLYWKIQSSAKKIRVPRGRLTYMKTELWMDQNKSFIEKNLQTPEMLRYCQTSFNLLEYYRRKTNQDLLANPDAQFDDVFNFYFSQHSEKDAEMADSTHFGQNTEVMDRFAAEVDSLLATPDIDPQQIPLGNRFGSLDVHFGYNYSYTSNDFYTNAPSGFKMGADWEYKRYLVGFDICSNFRAKSKQDYKSKDGPIEKGEEVDATQVLMQAGYLVNPSGKNSFYPMLCIGETHMNSRDKYTDENNKEHTPSRSGFCFGIGCRYDVPLFTHTHVFNGMDIYSWASNYRTTANQQFFALQVKPSVVFAKLKDSKGLYPIFNLSLSITMGYKAFANKIE